MTSPPSADHGDHQIRAAFAADPKAVTAARRYTEENLRNWQVGPQSAAAALIVSELASNAVRHAHSGFEVSLSVDHDVVRIVVSDASEVRPVPREPELGATSGYGLNIVRLFASDWGSRLSDHGKEVWVQLDRFPQPPLTGSGPVIGPRAPP